MKRSLLLLLLLLISITPAAAQNDCTTDPILTPRHHGITLVPLTIYQSSNPNDATSGQIPVGEMVQVLADSQPTCVGGIRWYQIDSMDGFGWIPETLNGQPTVEPYVFTPEAPVPFSVNRVKPVISNPSVPLPTVAPSANPQTLDVPFATWDWAAFTKDSYITAPDPLTMQLPAQYAGDLPVPPVDLSTIHFVKDANLNSDQLKLLAQNGFVALPSSYQQFDDVYNDHSQAWDHTTGKAQFITTDSMLHALFLTYQNALMFLETSNFYGDVADFLMKGYQAAEAQYRQAVGTPLESAARKAAIYYAVPLMLIAPGESSYVKGYDQTPVYGDGVQKPSDVIKAADPSIIAEAQPLVDLANAAQGREDVSILEDYQEDFSQYKPRSYYAGSPLLESYFRAMMWLGRITFRNKSAADTQTALLVLRALQSDPSAYTSWQNVADTLDFLIGPVDDYGPNEYTPLTQNLRGADFSLELIGSMNDIQAFQARVAQLPAPKINSIPIPAGATTLENVTNDERGFRLFGQRFTFDGYAMQQLIYPATGSAEHSRTLPLGLDIPLVFGSDIAFGIPTPNDTTSYEHYTDNVAKLRTEVNMTTANAWLQNLYGGWLWTLQPLAIRDAALVPPMMQTDAWKRKDLTTFLGSFTELKHATLLYAAQPMGGLGGGGMEPPVISYSYVEPNPLVFSRIAVVAALLDQGLKNRGFFDDRNGEPIGSIDSTLHTVGILSAMLADMARKEVAGEALSYDELYFLQENYGQLYWSIRYEIEQWITNPPKSMALVADVASNAATNAALEMATANPNLIYVVTNSPYGLQLTRGAAYSYHEFIAPIDQRMTDDEWRQMVADGSMPDLPTWINLYYAG